ncbi:MAG: hypothetical protein ACFFAL_00865 [Promethearchaeota archaeon]
MGNRIVHAIGGLNVEYRDLLNAYYQLLAVPKDQVLEDERSNLVVLLYETESLRILMIRSSEDEYPVRLETEVTFPLQVPDLNSIQDINQDPIQDRVLKPLLEDMKVHLEYLCTLTNAGFRLEIMGEEGVWIASYLLNKPPTRELYSLLKPPEKKLPKNPS